MNNLIKSVFINQRSEKKTRKGLKFYLLHMKVDMFAQNMCKLHLQGHCWNGPHISLLSFCQLYIFFKDKWSISHA